MKMLLNYIKRLPHITAIVLTMLLFYQVSDAIDVTGRGRKDSIERRNKSIPLNEWALQVAIDEKIGDDDDEYNGVRFSLIKYYSRYNAVRFNLGLVERAHDFSTDLIFNSHSQSIFFENSGNFDLDGVNLSIQYMFSPRPRGNVNVFWGIGPRLSLEEVNTDFVLTYYEDYPYSWADDVDINSNTLIGVGIEGSVGMEWFLARNFSLLFEYGFTLQNQWYIIDLDYYSDYGYQESDLESFDDGLHFDASRIKLGASIYF